MRKIYLATIILFLSPMLGFENSKKNSIVTNPFFKKQSVNFCLNDFSNYPIGIFKNTKSLTKYNVQLDLDSNLISISESTLSHQNLIPYISSLDNYLKDLYINNQRYNFSEPFSLSASDTTLASNKGRYLEVADFDLGALGRASLRVQGNINLSGKLVNQDQELVRSSYKEQEKTNFKFDQKQQLNVQGKVGEKITISLDQNSERDFDWENTIRVDYAGDEDDILQKLEIGNISLTLPSSEFVTFSGQNKGLFGIKSLTQLGPLNITSIASLERTKKQSEKYKGTSEVKTNQIQDYDYRKNLYFFIHEWFRDGSSDIISDSGFQVNIPSYYPLNNGLHNIGNLVIKNFELYKIDASNNPKADPGTAYIDPNDTSFYNDSSKEGAFIKLERGSDYAINEDLGFIRMQNTLQNEIIGAHFELADRTTGTIVLKIGANIGDDGNTTLVLKMLKAQSSHPNHPTWDLMFKNVYSLGSTNIDQTSLQVKILDNFSTPVSDRTNAGTTFLNLFGLDDLNQSGAPSPDEVIDFNNPNIVNLKTGEVHLPVLLPFVSSNNLNGGNDNNTLGPLLQQGKMYTSTNRTEYTGDSRFTIAADYTNPKSTINLGFTLVEGSEEIYSNGEKLERGQDYQIDYFSGMIMLTGNIDPNSDLEIVYDKHDLVTFDRKIMVGSRAQIDFDENSFLGMTALYYNQDIVNKKVEVGFEPIQNFIWDINGRYEKDLDNLSASLNKLDMFNAEKLSRFTLEGEIAQVLPNPNSISNAATGDSDGVAYIDDFEGSKRVTSPSILRRFWNISSAPLNLDTDQPFNQRNRARMYWYNPYSQVLTNNIWPNVSTSQRAQNLTTDILVLNFEPKEYQESVDPDSVWAGIVTPMFIGDYDQTRSRFFEIWLRGDEGNLTVDLGEISEDYNGDGSLNNEDVPDAGLALGNGFLEDSEDTGLDGCFDNFEDGWGNCLSTEDGLSYQDYLSSGEIAIINASSDVDVNDPNNDNWNYSEGSSDYTKVNGTEGNGTGDKIQAGGKYPDSEDLDQSGFLDRANDYFTKTISLDDSMYVAGSTIVDGVETGWRLIRIPLSHFSKVQDVALSEIKHVRLVVSGIDKPSQIEIAKMELVGNAWEEMGTSFVNQEDYAVQDSTFLVTVVNDEDNPDYIPPKGVFGEYDQINKIRSKEQSLVLRFDNLNPNIKGAAKKILSSMTSKKGQSFLIYDQMKMFVYGDSPNASEDNTDLRFFIQFGTGDEYYKLTKPVYDSWDEDQQRNAVDLDLNWLTSLKNMDENSIEKINANDTFTDSLDYKRYQFIDDSNQEYKKIEIVGNPSLSRLQYFVVGVENNSNHPITGEIWLDELRLSGVKKEQGMAVRLKSEFNLSDFNKSSISYSKKDADFHILQERIGTNNTTENLIFTNNMQLGSLFPQKFGIIFPMNMTYNMQNNAPKFFPGTDIRTNGATPDSILVKSSTVSLNGKISKQIKSENPFIKYTLDNLSASFNASNQNKSNEIMKSVDTKRLTTKLDYNLRFPSDNYIEAFKWMSKVPLIGQQISETKFFYTPTSFTTGFSVNRNLTEKESRSSTDLIDDFTLGLDRKFNINYKVFDNTQFSYSKNIKSDMSEYRDEVLNNLKIGKVTSSTESLGSTFNPQLLSWIKPNFSYNTNYSWNKPLSSVIDGANLAAVKNIGINFALSGTEIIETFYTPTSKRKAITPTNTRSRSESGLSRGEDVGAEDIKENKDPSLDKSSKKKEKRKLENSLLMEKIYQMSKKIEPLSVTINTTTNRTANGVSGDVPLSYRFGLSDSHGLENVPEVGLNTGAEDIKKSLSIRTGIRFNPGTSLNFSFSESISSNINGYNIDTRSTSRDYLAYGKNLSDGIPFSNWSLRIGGLEKIKFISPYVKAISLEHAFSGKENLSWKFSDDSVGAIDLFSISSFANDNDDNRQFSRISRSFTPLLGITTSFKNGISTNIRTNITHTLDEVANGLTYISDNSILASITYNFSKGIRFSLPFTERNVYLKNNMNITLNFDISQKKEEGSKDKINFAEQNFTNTRKSVLRITYALTDNVTGSLFYEYRENDTRLTGRRIDRDFGVNLNVAIRG
ncbi:MAG TPA: cell surface protein SprA [Candidatus Marinimicrobia bacterium]|jgi:cell surface protein SprA|nr:cell surface protein SprA [Candidatus Neomarinimicrobiota bacterium]HIL86331.1 cell surface protein SprA [Candidatus Neomarinimicrobiota bacterium]